MPVLIKAISDDKLQGVGVYDLDPSIPLIAAQAGTMLGRSKSRMDTDRKDGKPPKHYLDGSKVQYRLGDVLAERARVQGITPEEARAAAKKRIQQGEWTFDGFMAHGGLEDTWPIATVRGIPMDFFTTLTMDLDDEDLGEIQDMSLEQYLVERLQAGKLKVAQESQASLRAGTGMPTEHSTAETCPRCGRPIHAGQCRL